MRHARAGAVGKDVTRERIVGPEEEGGDFARTGVEAGALGLFDGGLYRFRYPVSLAV